MNNDEKFNATEYKKAYNKEKYKRISLEVKKSDFDIIDGFCKSRGISKNLFFHDLIINYISEQNKGE